MSANSELTVVVFSYDFEHKKTQDFLVRTYQEDIPVRMVLAAPRVELDVPSSSVRTKIRHRALLPPRMVAERLGYDFRVGHHDAEETVDLLRELSPDIGVIAGARILPASVIESFNIGIINFHPGLIPEVRGLDAMLWAVHDGEQQGVTAHLIDEHVDAGEVLLRREIPVYADDTALDLQERLYETQLELLAPAVERARKDAGSGRLTATVEAESTEYNRKMSPELERKTLERLPDYVERRAESEHG